MRRGAAAIEGGRSMRLVHCLACGNPMVRIRRCDALKPWHRAKRSGIGKWCPESGRRKPKPAPTVAAVPVLGV